MESVSMNLLLKCLSTKIVYASSYTNKTELTLHNNEYMSRNSEKHDKKKLHQYFRYFKRTH